MNDKRQSPDAKTRRSIALPSHQRPALTAEAAPPRSLVFDSKHFRIIMPKGRIALYFCSGATRPRTNAKTKYFLLFLSLKYVADALHTVPTASLNTLYPIWRYLVRRYRCGPVPKPDSVYTEVVRARGFVELDWARKESEAESVFVPYDPESPSSQDDIFDDYSPPVSTDGLTLTFRGHPPFNIGFIGSWKGASSVIFDLRRIGSVKFDDLMSAAQRRMKRAIPDADKFAAIDDLRIAQQVFQTAMEQRLPRLWIGLPGVSISIVKSLRLQQIGEDAGFAKALKRSTSQSSKTLTRATVEDLGSLTEVANIEIVYQDATAALAELIMLDYVPELGAWIRNWREYGHAVRKNVMLRQLLGHEGSLSATFQCVRLLRSPPIPPTLNDFWHRNRKAIGQFLTRRADDDGAFVEYEPISGAMSKVKRIHYTACAVMCAHWAEVDSGVLRRGVEWLLDSVECGRLEKDDRPHRSTLAALVSLTHLRDTVAREEPNHCLHRLVPRIESAIETTHLCLDRLGPLRWLPWEEGDLTDRRLMHSLYEFVICLDMLADCSTDRMDDYLVASIAESLDLLLGQGIRGRWTRDRYLPYCAAIGSILSVLAERTGFRARFGESAKKMAGDLVTKGLAWILEKRGKAMDGDLAACALYWLSRGRADLVAGEM